MKVLQPQKLLEARNKLEYEALVKAFSSANVPIEITKDYTWKDIDAQADKLGFQVICKYTATSIHVIIKKTVYDVTDELDTDKLHDDKVIDKAL